MTLDPYAHLEEADASGRWVPGPPWILGHRGAPREAPENTLVGLRRALEIGLDGVEYDLRACATREPVLLHDEDLARTTDALGPLAGRGLAELFGIDAGAWFGRRFEGEPLPLLDEALELARPDGTPPIHMIEIKEPGMAAEVAERLEAYDERLTFRVASFLLDEMRAARDLGLPTMYLVEVADDEALRTARRERFDAIGVGPGGWRTNAWLQEWRGLERWAWSVDEPRDLLEVCRGGFTGFNTNEPHRALAARALVRLTPDDDDPWPVDVPVVEVDPDALDADTARRGGWFGHWTIEARVRNPLPIPVEARCGVFVRSGAFEVEGAPTAFDLEPHEERVLPLTLHGGARVPGPDPLFAALLRWKGDPAPGVTGATLRAGGQLLFDAPIERRRVARVDGMARRLWLLAEEAGAPPASVTVLVRGTTLQLSIESDGDVEEAMLAVRLGDEVRRGGRHVRMRLPEHAHRMPDGVPFALAIEGRKAGRAVQRRWSGGWPPGLGHGRPGRLHVDADA